MESHQILLVTAGVPQGTVLDPVLFLGYINDLPEDLKSSQLRVFADDSITYKLSNPKGIVIVSKKTLMLPQDGKVTG